MGTTTRFLAIIGMAALVVAGAIIYAFTDSPGTKATAEAKDAASQSLGFGIRLFKELADSQSTENLVLSGTSVAIALAMYQPIASNGSGQLIPKALGFEDEEKLAVGFSDLLKRLDSTGDVVLKVSNGMFVPPGSSVGESAATRIHPGFQPEVFTTSADPGAASDEMNQWISRHTMGQITDMVAPDLAGTTILTLINAIAFKGAWETSFDPAKTFQSPFFPESGERFDVTMMSEEIKIPMHVTPTYGAVRFPYKGGQHSMVAIKPRGDRTLSDLRGELSESMWKDTWAALLEAQAHEQSVRFPKFKLAWGAELSGLLMSERFRALATGGEIQTSVRHEARVEVDEAGTTASAATVIRDWALGIDEGPPPFTPTFSRPFLFAIVDHDSGAILFLGQVVDPRKE